MRGKNRKRNELKKTSYTNLFCFVLFFFKLKINLIRGELVWVLTPSQFPRPFVASNVNKRKKALAIQKAKGFGDLFIKLCELKQLMKQKL
jgi:hypothetical protein